jgi:hypothetical protein
MNYTVEGLPFEELLHALVAIFSDHSVWQLKRTRL